MPKGIAALCSWLIMEPYVLGETMEGAFRVAVSLELLSSHQIKMAFEETLGRPMTMEDSLYDIILNRLNVSIPEEGCPLYYSHRIGTCMEFFRNEEKHIVELQEDTADFAETVHRKIYLARPDIDYISQYTNASMLAYSVLGREIATYIDDFAQINGPIMGCSDLDADRIVAALGENHGVQVKASGVLCCGKTYRRCRRFGHGRGKECQSMVDLSVVSRGNSSDPTGGM